MSREVKPGKLFSCKLRTVIYETLDAYSKQSFMPKTSIVEKALEEYLADKVDLNKRNKEKEDDLN